MSEMKSNTVVLCYTLKIGREFHDAEALHDQHNDIEAASIDKHYEQNPINAYSRQLISEVLMWHALHCTHYKITSGSTMSFVLFRPMHA